MPRSPQASVPPLALCLSAGLWAAAEASVMTIDIPGATLITEADIRVGGRELGLHLKGDTWKRNFALYAPAVWQLISSGSSVNEEPAAFSVYKSEIIPTQDIVIDQRRNDYSALALLFRPAPSYNIKKDEVIYIQVPVNATQSGTAPTGDVSVFVVKAGLAMLQKPAVITEEMIRRGDLNMTFTLLWGERFVTRGVQRETAVREMIDLIISDLVSVPGENSNFEVRKNLIIQPIHFDILSAGDSLTIRFQPDPLYNFYAAREVVNFTLPPVFITSGFVPASTEPLGFVVENSPGTVTLVEPLGGLTEAAIRAGTAEFILVLQHDIWDLADNTSAVVQERKVVFINSFVSPDPNGAFNRRMAAGTLLKPSGIQLLDAKPTRKSEQRLRVRFEADPAYILAARDTISLFIPQEMLVSRLAPFSAGGGPNFFQAKVLAMGDLGYSPTFEPRHSGDVIGLPGAEVFMSLTVTLKKDKWKEVACRDVLRTGFSSSHPSMPHGFMSKLDRIVNPAGVSFTKCTSGLSCTMTVQLSREATYSLVPQELASPEAETITLNVPKECVGYDVAPSGRAQFTIDIHPSEISYDLYMPAYLEKGEQIGVVYAGRAFYVEAHYGNPESWRAVHLVNSLQCSSFDVPQIPADAYGNCTQYSCFTGAASFTHTHSIRFGPKTQAGVWSVCIHYSYTQTRVRLGQPIVIETDPTQVLPPAVPTVGGSVDPYIVAVRCL